jgi:transposase
MVDRKIVTDLYKQGKTYEEIGTYFHVSKQRIYQIINQLHLVRANNPQQSRIYRVVNPRPSERYIGEILQKKRFQIEYMPYNCTFDILLNKKYRIEVKHRKVSDKAGYYRVGYLNPFKFHYLILILGEIPTESIYIIPSRSAKTFMKINPNPFYRTKYNKLFLKQWSNIKKN